jgi:hypothetical protein
MIIPISPRTLRSVKDKTVQDALREINTEISRVVNGNLNFGSPEDQLLKNPPTAGNMHGSWPGTLVALGGYQIITPVTPNTEFTVNHNLGHIPIGYDVKGQDQAGIVYDSRRNLWTNTQMFLKCNVASMNIRLFVH